MSYLGMFIKIEKGKAVVETDYFSRQIVDTYNSALVRLPTRLNPSMQGCFKIDLGSE